MFIITQNIPHANNITQTRRFITNLSLAFLTEDLSSLVQTITVKINDATSRELNHPHYLRILFVKRKLKSNSLLKKKEKEALL